MHGPGGLGQAARTIEEGIQGGRFVGAEIEAEAKRMTVLVADDDETVRELVRLVLRRALPKGTEIICAEDGGQLLDNFTERGGEVDLVVSDVNMPNVSGPEAVETILNISSGMRRVVRVLFFSALGENSQTQAHVLRLLEANPGCIGLVNKPAEITEVVAAIRVLLGG